MAKPAKERRIQTSQDSRVGIRGNSKINNLVGEQGKENAINGNTNHQAERSVERDKQKFNGLRISTPTGFGAGTKVNNILKSLYLFYPRRSLELLTIIDQTRLRAFLSS